MNNPTPEERKAEMEETIAQFMEHVARSEYETDQEIESCLSDWMKSTFRPAIRQAEKVAKLDEFEKLVYVWSDHTDEYVKEIEDYITNRRKQLEESR